MQRSARRVLIADDDLRVARRYAELLSELPELEVLAPVADGRAALEQFQNLQPDAVLLDLRMPLLSGLDVLRGIRAVDRECLVIVLTSADEPSLRSSCAEAGADHYLVKRDSERLPELLRARWPA